jgi:group II intron reverse transcriptase/maturase
MRNADTILGIIQERGNKGLHLEDVYRQLYNPELYLRAYGRIYANKGALTRGTNEETVDGMSQMKITDIIEALRFERWKWTPVRRVEIPKSNGKTRPLGIPTWSDKLLQEVIRSLLEAYYEPQFYEHSHGFRPKRGCHTALSHIEKVWTGTKWFIEGDIHGCFDNISHSVLLDILREKIHDNRFLILIENLLKAGYMEEWKYRPSLSGTPQGGICSPILANIYLDKLDRFVYDTLLPANNKGAVRKWNPDYRRLCDKRLRLIKSGLPEEAKEYLKQMRQLPSHDPNDPDFRRLRYVRYADDFILGFVGSKQEAEAIKEQIREFLKDTLLLELSEEKTLITHAREKARFLGHDITVQHNDTRRAINGQTALRIPPSFIEETSNRYKRNGKPIHRAELLNDSDFDIVTRYQQEYRGFVNFYNRAVNVSWMHKLHWIMRMSLLKTLASKHKSSVNKITNKYKATVKTSQGPRRCLQVIVHGKTGKTYIATFGGISLKRNPKATIIEAKPTFSSRTELVKRLLADKCEVCGNTEDVEVHHIRKLADLKVQGRREPPLWKRIMSARRRKTLVLCAICHDDLHAGRPLEKNLK